MWKYDIFRFIVYNVIIYNAYAGHKENIINIGSGWFTSFGIEIISSAKLQISHVHSHWFI